MSAADHLRDAIGDRLDRLAAAHGPVGFWLRDDDAVAPSAALDRLIAIAADAGAPLALAVIPEPATAALADRLASAEAVTVLQHGFSHRNHAAPDAKKSELGAERPLDVVLAELGEGRDRLLRFPRVRPVLAPPWNRLDAAVAAALPDLGFAGLSLFGETRKNPAARLRHINTHLDLVAWHDGRRFVGSAAILSRLAARLDRMLAGEADPREPTGLLTHHLVHDEETFTFLDDFMAYLSASPSCRWLSIDALLASKWNNKRWPAHERPSAR